jgi:hypothetical protein
MRIPGDFTIQGWVEKIPEGATGRRARPRPTSEEKDYGLEHWGAYKSTLSVSRPYAYVYPRSLVKLTEKLRQHGIPVVRASGSRAVAAEIYRVDKINRARSLFQKHRLLTLEVTPRQEQETIDADSMIVRTGHHLGNLIVYLLEPQAADGLAAWNLLDDVLAEGKDYPVLRVTRPF